MAFSAVLQKPDIDFGNVKAGIWKVIHDNSTATFDTGWNHVMFATCVSETGTNGIDQVVFDSSAGTAGDSPGSVYFTAEGNTDVTYFLVLGW